MEANKTSSLKLESPTLSCNPTKWSIALKQFVGLCATVMKLNFSTDFKLA